MNTATHTAIVKAWPYEGTGTEEVAPAKVTQKPRHYSATGYGRKLPMRYMVHYRGRWRRVYCCLLSNSGTAYIGKPGAWVAVVDSIEQATAQQ